MKLPAIFHWPSPWIWGAVTILMLTGAGGLSGSLRAVALTTLVAGAVYFIRERTCNRTGSRRSGGAHEPSAAGSIGLDERLQTIERRLTDTQDVMIALSEKVDQWEAERAKETSQC